MNPQRVELVPHGALSARLRWTRFLLQWLQRPPGYTECPHFNPASPVAEHNASNVTSQQRRGFHPTCHMHCKQRRAKKGNEPPKGRTCPSRCSECPSPMEPTPLAVPAAPPGVHRMPSLRARLPSGRAQRFKCHQSAAQRFSPYLPHALQANESKKRNDPQRVERVPHGALSARLRWTRFLLQWLQRPLGYTECPHFNPDSPVAVHKASNVTNQQRRGLHPTCHMRCKQMRAKKGNEPPKG